MADEKDQNDARKPLVQEMPGFLGDSVMDLDTGMVLGVRPDLADGARAWSHEILKQKLRS